MEVQAVLIIIYVLKYIMIFMLQSFKLYYIPEVLNMNKYSSKANKLIRIVCLFLAIGMILSAFASGMLMFF